MKHQQAFCKWASIIWLSKFQVGGEIAQVTGDMRVIADGLGSGVTPEQIQTSIELGQQWLDEIKKHDFDTERDLANEKQQAALGLVESVKNFAAPVEEFKANVSGVNDIIVDLKEKLSDLKNNSENTMRMVQKGLSNRMTF